MADHDRLPQTKPERQAPDAALIEAARKDPIITTERTEALDAKFKPRDLHIIEYAIPNALGKAEYEEIAARVIAMAQREGKFVAASFPALALQVYEEARIAHERDEAARRKFESKPRITFGQMLKERLAQLLRREQTAPPAAEEAPIVEEEPLPISVFSLICRFNPNALPAAIRQMVDKGYLTTTAQNSKDYLEPTEQLIMEILAAQQKREQRQ